MKRFDLIVAETKKHKQETGRMTTSFIMRKFQVTYKYALIVMAVLNQM